MGGWQRFMQQWSQVWVRLSPKGRVAFGGAGAAFLVLIVWVGFWASTTNYAVLFNGLQPEDTAAISQKLDADRIPYELAGDGATILVPVDRVLKTRMSLNIAGLPQGAGKGFEIFDSMSMGTTPFVQNLYYVRATQGELTRTIMQLDAVGLARVHIVQSDPSPFIRDEKPVTASVWIRTKPSHKLTHDVTSGIVAFMAGSVKGLTPENVTVIDSKGHVHTERPDSQGGLVSSKQREHQREVEADLTRKAQEILDRALGPGQAVVRVTAVMKFLHVEEQSKKIDPDGRVATHESTTSSKTTSPAGPRGTVGAAGNVPGAQPPAANANGPLTQNETIESEYEISSTRRQFVENQETIDRITVAVILMPTSDDPDADPEEVLAISSADAEKLVKQAVGFIEKRDDIQVSIGKPSAPGTDLEETPGVVAAQRWQNYIHLVKASALVIAALAGLIMVVMMYRSRPAVPSQAVKPIDPVASQEPLDVGAVVSVLKSWLGDSSRNAQPT